MLSGVFFVVTFLFIVTSMFSMPLALGFFKTWLIIFLKIPFNLLNFKLKFELKMYKMKYSLSLFLGQLYITLLKFVCILIKK